MAEAVRKASPAVGVSNFNAELTQRATMPWPGEGFPSQRTSCNTTCWTESGANRPGTLCRDLGVTIIAYSPLAQGLLTGKYSPQNPFPGAYRRLQWGRFVRRAALLVTTLREIGQAHARKTPGQVASNWVICKGALPIPGAKNAAQASEKSPALPAGDSLQLGGVFLDEFELRGLLIEG